MSLAKWPSVKLSSGSVIMPRTCPNCLAPSTWNWRYGYRSALWILSRTTYYQTFYYCEDCAKQLKRYFRWRSVTGFFGFFMYIAAVVGTLIFADNLKLPTKGLGLALGIGLTVAAVALVWAGLRGVRTAILSRQKLNDKQAGYGPAAYYTGPSLGVLGGGEIYKSLRPEWLRALIEANPALVDDETYRREVGREKPAKQKPFAAASGSSAG